MAEHRITLDRHQEQALQEAARAANISIETLLTVALAEPEILGPITALRGMGYPQATGPFLIDQTVSPEVRTLCPPPPLTRSNLLRLQSAGVTVVNITFNERGIDMQADLIVNQLLNAHNLFKSGT